jgi:hypothetical protein
LQRCKRVGSNLYHKINERKRKNTRKNQWLNVQNIILHYQANFFVKIILLLGYARWRSGGDESSHQQAAHFASINRL